MRPGLESGLHMSEGVVVGPNRYGKQNVRMLRVVRDSPTHEVYALTCAMLLEGNAFTKNYTEGDHSSLIPTETQKNTLYVLSKKYPIEPIERWAVLVAKDVMARHKHVEAVHLHVDRSPWDRALVDGKPHNHVFVEGKSGTQFTTLRVEANGHIEISSGFKDFKIMKTTQSGFEGYIVDEYTTLKPTKDRVMATKIFCEYHFSSIADFDQIDFSKIYAAVQQATVEHFAGDPVTGVYSPSVQKTIYDIGKEVLKRYPFLDKITFKLPNIHYYGVDFKDFKTDLVNNGEVFLTFDGAHGQIEATIQRPPKSKL